MKKVKVLIAVAAHYSRSRAFESFLKEECYDVRVVTRDMSNKYNFMNFFREIISWKPQIVHAINDPEVMLIPIILASKLVGANVLYDVRGICSLLRKETRRNDMYYYVERFAERFNDIFSDRKITPVYRIHKKRNYALIPQTISFRKRVCHARHGKKQIILTACTLSKMRELEVLIDSMRFIQNPDVELWIFGDGVEKEKIEAEAKKDSRIFVFGRIPYDLFIKKIPRADVCIIPFSKMISSEYTSPYSVLKLGEFTFFQKPIVCADVGDMRLAEKNGVVFYKPGDSKDLAVKISSQLKNPKKTTFFRELDRKDVKKKYLAVVRSLF
ncbi:MAG: glycosyltransferase [Candidatus Aenigmarchaeota archaeon]|nr:glycosyltransferase [Candidatus Aenigmarchaeota archaeon]